MYVPEDYASYKYVVSYHDNYIVLTNRSSISASWDNVQTVPIIYQYFKPSTYTFDGFTTFNSSRSFEEIEISHSEFDRADYPEILQSQFFVIFFILFILNGLTKFVKRGGIFFGQ